jgi:hypothetical protein
MQYKSVVQSLKVVNDNPVSGFCHGQAGIIMLAGHLESYSGMMSVPPFGWMAVTNFLIREL